MAQPSRPPTPELALLGLLALLWGSSYLLIRIAVETIPPITLIAGRVTIAAAFLVAVIGWTGQRLPLLAAAKANRSTDQRNPIAGKALSQGRKHACQPGATAGRTETVFPVSRSGQRIGRRASVPSACFLAPAETE